MGPTFRTNVAETASGHESRDQQWLRERVRFMFSHTGLYQAEHQQLEAFFIARAGRAGAFRVKHPGDYLLTSSNNQLVPLDPDGNEIGTAGLGYGVATYAMRRAKTYSSLTTYKTITKPVVGTTAVRAGTPVTLGSADGNVALDTTTGVFTFVKDQTRNVSAHTVGADHIFTFASAFSPNFAVGGRIWITGVTGTAATILNDMSHEITGVTGADITIATATTALTASGGSGQFFPQPTQTLTAYGEFDYPCRFTSDEATFDIVDKNVQNGYIWQWRGIDLIEVRDE